MNATLPDPTPSLPDLSRIASAPAGALGSFAARLRAIGLTLERAAPVVAAVEPIAPHLRAPIRAYHLRRIREPVGYAMRMLLFGDAVTKTEAREALGPLFEPMLDLGVVACPGPDAVVSPFRLSIVDDLLVLCDDLALGGEAVMGLGATTTKLCRAAAASRDPLGRALDLGCGAGTCALVLSRVAREVVATDISARAVELCRINAAMNGVRNVVVRQGDLFAPVAGEAFDLVVSQPPFVPRPEGASEASFLYGGAVGDEIALRLFGAIAPHLADDGRALVVVEWPERGGAAIGERVRGALGPGDIDTLVLRTPTTSPDEHAVAYAAGMHATLGEPFERDARDRREHLARLGIEGLTLTLVALRRRRDAAVWTRVVNVGAWPAIDPTGGRIEALIAAQDLVGHPQALLAATLRMPEGTVLSEEQDGPGPDRPSRVLARFSPAALASPIGLPHDLLMIATMVHEAATVEEGIRRFAEEYEVSPEDAASRLLPALERMLAAGAFEVGARPDAAPDVD